MALSNNLSELLLPLGIAWKLSWQNHTQVYTEVCKGRVCAWLLYVYLPKNLIFHVKVEYLLIKTSGCTVWLKELASSPSPRCVTGLWLRDATAKPIKIIQNNEDLKDASVNICLLLNVSDRGITTSDDKCLAKMINLSDLGWHLRWVALTLKKMPWRIPCHWVMWAEQTNCV